MTSLLCLPPMILDQSSPSSPEQLSRSAQALGEIEALVSNGQVQIILTPVYLDIVQEFTWDPPSCHGLLQDVYRVLTMLTVGPNPGAVHIAPVCDGPYHSHPAPVGSETLELIDFWSDETGKLLILHDRASGKGEYFIGIACDAAFSGGNLNTYPEMHVLIGREKRFQMVEEPDEFAASVTLVTSADHLTIENIECREKSGRAIAFISVRLTLRQTIAHSRKTGTPQTERLRNSSRLSCHCE